MQSQSLSAAGLDPVTPTPQTSESQQRKTRSGCTGLSWAFGAWVFGVDSFQVYSLSLGSRCSRPSMSVTSYRIEHNVSVYKNIFADDDDDYEGLWWWGHRVNYLNYESTRARFDYHIGIPTYIHIIHTHIYIYTYIYANIHIHIYTYLTYTHIYT